MESSDNKNLIEEEDKELLPFRSHTCLIENRNDLWRYVGENTTEISLNNYERLDLEITNLVSKELYDIYNPFINNETNSQKKKTFRIGEIRECYNDFKFISNKIFAEYK